MENKTKMYIDSDGKKTISLNGGKYKIKYDETNRYPELVSRYNDRYWRDVSTDAVIQLLCDALYSSTNAESA